MQAKPFVKWVGGKAGLWNSLHPLTPKQFNHYSEPFVGGGATFFNLAPEQATLTDVNQALISCYKAIQFDVEDVIENTFLLQKRYDTEDRKALYYEMRDFYNNDNDMRFHSHGAALFIFLNKTGFNGLYRENKSGKYNNPFGDGRNKTISDPDNLRAVSRLLQGVRLAAGDFEDMVSFANPKRGDFVYFDPPYIPLDANSFTGYNGGGFGLDDQKRLVKLCHFLDGRVVKWMVSQSDAPLSRELWEPWAETTYQVQAARPVNSDKNGRGKVGELVITNYPIEKSKDAAFARELMIHV